MQWLDTLIINWHLFTFPQQHFLRTKTSNFFSGLIKSNNFESPFLQNFYLSHKGLQEPINLEVIYLYTYTEAEVYSLGMLRFLSNLCFLQDYINPG